jgi:hypothetical protein
MLRTPTDLFFRYIRWENGRNFINVAHVIDGGARCERPNARPLMAA